MKVLFIVKHYCSYLTILATQFAIAEQLHVRLCQAEQSPHLMRHDRCRQEQERYGQCPLPRQDDVCDDRVDNHQQGPQHQIGEETYRVTEGVIFKFGKEEVAEQLDGQRKYRDGDKVRQCHDKNKCSNNA